VNLYHPRGDQSLNDLGDDVAWNKRVSNVTRALPTDGNGTTQFTGSRRGRIAFVPRGVPTEPTETVVRRVTPDPKLLLLASGWRARAKEILLRAATMKEADARQEMREVAASYERLAQRVKQLSGDADKA
jgi:hypothetical protein